MCAKGQRILLALGNGVMTRYAYDDNTFRLVRQRTETYNQTVWEFSPDGSVKQDTAYSYDLAGNIIETTENRTNAGFGTTLAGGQGPTPDKLIREFDYDPLYRLILATGREDTSHSHNLIWQDTSPVAPTPANSREYRRTYQYDKMGNILKLAHTAHQASFTRNFGYHSTMQHNKLEEVLDNSQSTLTNFQYDAAGNTIQSNSERFYIWDAANQLKQFKIDDGQTVSVYGQYIYSGGQRVKKLVKDQQGNYTITVYIDGVFEYQKLVKGTNTFERNYTHIMDDRSRIATVRAGSDEDDITEDAFYVVEDHLNSSTARLKATDGSVIDREEFYPFGETCLHSFSKKRYRYTGKEKDSESGLYYYGARYYSAWTCRFVSVDPLAGDFAHLTPYNYAGNKPINARDIDGLQGENENQSVSSSQNIDSIGNSTTNNTTQQIVDRMDSMFDQMPQGDKGTDWHFIEQNTYLNQMNSQGEKPGNFFYSSQLGRRNGKQNVFYRYSNMSTESEATQAFSDSNTQTNSSVTTIDSDQMVSFVANTAQINQLDNDLIQNLSTSMVNSTIQNTTNSSESTTSETRTPVTSSETLVETTTTQITSRVTSSQTTQSNLTINQSTVAGNGFAPTIQARFRVIQGLLINAGVSPDNIQQGNPQFGANINTLGGVNQTTFNINTTSTTVIEVQMRTTISRQQTLIFHGYTD